MTSHLLILDKANAFNLALFIHSRGVRIQEKPVFEEIVYHNFVLPQPYAIFFKSGKWLHY